jgi:hypothetical protein
MVMKKIYIYLYFLIWLNSVWILSQMARLFVSQVMDWNHKSIGGKKI